MAEANMKLLGDEIRRFREQAHPQRISLFRLYEPFFLAYSECMKCQLLPEDYARFVKCWNEVEVGMDDVFPVHPHIKMHLGTDEITFVIHMVELLHVDRLLYVGYYEPKNHGAGNRERCEAYFTNYSPGKKACIRAWDYNDDGPTSIES